MAALAHPGAACGPDFRQGVRNRGNEPSKGYKLVDRLPRLGARSARHSSVGIDADANVCDITRRRGLEAQVGDSKGVGLTGEAGKEGPFRLSTQDGATFIGGNAPEEVGAISELITEGMESIGKGTDQLIQVAESPTIQVLQESIIQRRLGATPRVWQDLEAFVGGCNDNLLNRGGGTMRVAESKNEG